MVLTKDPIVIAKAIAESPQFLGAIKQGLAIQVPSAPDVYGPNQAQAIASKIREAIKVSV